MWLQQCLPLTVLKLTQFAQVNEDLKGLQQCLPLTVLKPARNNIDKENLKVATVLTAYGIETYILQNGFSLK